MADSMKAGAADVLEHGTAKTRAAAEKSKPKDGPKGDGKGKKGKKRIRRLVVEPADDGSMVIRHEHHQPEGEMGMAAAGGQRHEDETYTAPDVEGLKAHIDEHLGGGAAEPGEGEGEREAAVEEERGGEGAGQGAAA
jgi:hypothetical protein